MTTVQVVLEAFDAEASKWKRLAPVMTDAAKAADNMVLTPAAFFAGTDLVAPLLLTPSYNNLKDLIHTLCTQAATEYTQLAQAMDRAKGEYQRADGEAARVLSKPIFGS